MNDSKGKKAQNIFQNPAIKNSPGHIKQPSIKGIGKVPDTNMKKMDMDMDMKSMDMGDMDMDNNKDYK